MVRHRSSRPYSWQWRCRVAVLWLAGLIGSALPLVSQAALAQPTIEWRLQNPFRFFTDPAHTEVHRATWTSLSDEERRRPVLAAERALAERHNGEGWAATMLDDTCWDTKRHRHACKGYKDYLNPTEHRIVAQVRGIEDAEVECLWLTAPRARNVRGQAVKAPCGETVELDIPYPAGGRVTLEIGGRQVAEANIHIEDILVVGIGDSFGSGEGNPDVPVRFSRERSADYGNLSRPEMAGFPARVGNWQQIGDKAFLDANPRWLDQACHRSLYSHQLRAALQLAIERTDRAVTFVSHACSGAEITQGLFLRYKGHEWVPNPPDLSQISAVAQAQCGNREAPPHDYPEAYHVGGKVPDLANVVLRKCDAEHARRIDLLLVSVGGNDVGFARLLANAVLSDTSTLRRVGGWMGHVHGFVEANQQLERLVDRYKSLNRALHYILHIPWNETDRVLLVSYPPMALLEDGRSLCPDGRAGMTVVPDFALSTDKARDSMTAAERLHDIMADTTRLHRWNLVDGHRDDFQGRSICSGYTDQALSSADDLRLPRKVNGEWEPFNPADWRAYTQRQRWFRTPNDAFMAGHFHVSRSIMQKAVPVNTLSWFQVLLASLYSGAFHPTAEGQAAIADAVVDKARRVLAKYEAHAPARR
jgi:lysophospholipase L1-like esterase